MEAPCDTQHPFAVMLQVLGKSEATIKVTVLGKLKKANMVHMDATSVTIVPIIRDTARCGGGEGLVKRVFGGGGGGGVGDDAKSQIGARWWWWWWWWWEKWVCG